MGKLRISDGIDIHYGDLNLQAGVYQVNGTTVIDSSRNLQNIGTISSGAITSSGTIDVNSDSGQLQFGADNDMQIFHNGAGGEINNTTGNFTIDSSGDIDLDADGGDIKLRDAGVLFGSLSNSSSNLVIKSGSTTVLDSSRNLTNIGSISANDLTTQNSVSLASHGVVDLVTIGSGSRAGALKINDTAGANYFITAGGFDLTFYKNISGTSNTAVMQFVGANASDSTPDVRVVNNLTVDGTISSGAITATGLTTLTNVKSLTDLFLSRNDGTSPAVVISHFDRFRFITDHTGNYNEAQLGVNPSDVLFTNNGYAINTTTVIDSNRNLANIGTITTTGDVQIGASNVAGTHALKVYHTDNFEAAKFATNQLGSLARFTNASTSIEIGNQSGEAVFRTGNTVRLAANSANGNVRVATGALQMGTTTVITSSRNLTNIGTISSGAITSTGNLLLDSASAEINLKSGIGTESGAVNWTFNTTGTNFASIKLPYDTRATTGFHVDSGYPITLDATTRINFAIGGNTRFRITNTDFEVGTTPIIDLNRNLTNIGTISSGAITSSGNIAISAGNKIQLSGATDGTHHIYHNSSTDYDIVNYSTGFQLEHTTSGTQFSLVGSTGNATFSGGITTGGVIEQTASEGREIRTYMPSSYTTNDIVSGHEYGWYNDYWIVGMSRSGNASGEAFRFNYSGTYVAQIGTTGIFDGTGYRVNNTTVIDSSRKILNLHGGMTLQQDGTYGSGYGMLSFSGTTNGHNRIFGANTANDGLYLCSATGRNVFVRSNGNNNTDITLGRDATYSAYSVIGFQYQNVANGSNRIFAKNDGSDGLYIASATGKPIYFRTNGGTANTFTMTSGGNFQVNDTNILDQSRNLTNIGTISSGAITSTGISLFGKTVADNTTNGIRIDGTNDFVSIVRDGDLPLLLNRKTSDGDIALFRKDGGTVGSIGANGGTLYISSPYGSDAGLRIGNGFVAPATNTGGANNNAIDLGYSGNAYKKLWVNQIAIGTTAVIDSSRNLTNIALINSATITATSGSDQRVLKLKQASNNTGNIIQFLDQADANQWEITGRNNGFYIYKNTGTGSGYKYQINTSGQHTFSGDTTFNSAVEVIGNLDGTTADFGGAVSVDSLKQGLTTVLDNSRNLTNIGTINSGTINSSAINVNASGASDTRIEVGAGTTANHYAYIDLVTDTTYTDYGLRILRDNSGANASSTIGHRGTGNLNIIAYESASIRLNTGGQNALTLNSSQNAEFSGNVEMATFLSTGNATVEGTFTSEGLFTTDNKAQIEGSKSSATDAVATIKNKNASNEGRYLQFLSSIGTNVGQIGHVDQTESNIFIATFSTGLKFESYITYKAILPCNENGADSDNAIDLGSSSVRFDDVYATNGTIQTSDRNEKQDIQALTDAEQRVATACKGLIRRFRWQDSVAEKDDNSDSDETARYHFGVIAQDLQDAFTAEGLDASDYGMFISSTWEDDDGVEQTRFGVRYNELLAFIITTI